MRATSKKWILTILAVSLLLFGCQEYKNHEGVMSFISASTAIPAGPADLQQAPSVPTVKVSEPYQGGEFYTDTRKDKIGRYPCSGCHNGQIAKVTSAREMAHGEIVLNHGAVTQPDACHTCHNMDSRDYLVTDTGVKIDFDHSYQKCAQCHFRQKKDWVGGAHGKRLSFWLGQRVVANCTSCHNPHSPRFEKRWPATYSPSDVVLQSSESQEDNH